MLHDNLAVVGLTDFSWQLLFASSFPAFFAVPLIASRIRSMAELAALGAPFEHHMMTPGWSATLT
jgi:hypothetical protein